MMLCSMDKVSWRAVHAALGLAEIGKIDRASLLRDFPFRESNIRDMRWIDWDDYCTLLERLERQCGGPAAVDALTAQHYYTLLAEFAQLVRMFVSPEALYRAVFTLIMPASFPNQEMSCEMIASGV